MNSTSQLDLHPDAESLNAFLERALPDRERGQILAHIALCSQCRQVVFLAQEAAADLNSVQRAPQPAFRQIGWRFAWVPATALAAVVALAIFVHLRRAEQGAELAGIVPPVTSQNERIVANSPPPEQGKTATEGFHVSAKHSAANAPTGPSRSRSDALSAEAVVPAVAAANASSNTPGAGGDFRASPPAVSGQIFSASQFKAEPTAESSNAYSYAGGAGSSDSVTAPATQERMDKLEERQQASRRSSEAASVLQRQTAPGSRGDFDLAAPPPMAGMAAARKPKITPLPSGRIAVSTATALHLILSLDQAGALFLSDDEGRNWEPVARQWTGRAIQVRIQQSLHNVGAASAEPDAKDSQENSNESAVPVSVVSTAVFEIVNDNNLIWVSADGKNWKAK